MSKVFMEEEGEWRELFWNYWEPGEMPGPSVRASELQARTKRASRVFPKSRGVGTRKGGRGDMDIGKEWKDPQRKTYCSASVGAKALPLICRLTVWLIP